MPFQTGQIKAFNDKGAIVEIGDSKTLTVEGCASGAAVGTDVVVAGPADKAIFEKISLKVGKVISAKQHPEADKLLVLKVDIGESEPRQIVAGIANVFSPSDLVDHRVTIVANLKPSKLRGLASHGMILAAGGEKLQALAIAPESVALGTELYWSGNDETGLIAAKDTESKQQLLTLSASCEKGAVVR